MLFAAVVTEDCDPDGAPVYTHLRVIGWRLEQGYAPFPVVIGTQGRIRGIAIFPPDEGGGTGVRSCLTGRFYETVKDWYRVEEDLMSGDDPAPAGNDALAALDILFTDRGFKKQSFWRFNGPGHAPFMFVVDAGDYIPEDPRVDKITRADFQKNRPSLAEVPYAALFGAPQPRSAPEAPPEPEADDYDETDLI